MTPHPFITNIQRFSVDDGPGIRTTVFFKGCTLKCKWCHNPECIDAKPVLEFNSDLCTACGACENACVRGGHIVSESKHIINREKCTACGECVKACPSKALGIIGKQYSCEELYKIIRRDRNFYKESGGGVTFSGGECLMYPDYLISVMELCKKDGIGICIDTAANVDFLALKKVMPYADIFLVDIKQAKGEAHKGSTGADNERILDNISKLCAADARVIIRVPVIPGENESVDNHKNIAEIIAGLKHIPELIELLPYHKYGVGKYKSIGWMDKVFDTDVPTEEMMENLRKIYVDKGLNVLINGR